ncbi:MAG: hypothetical protein ACI9ZH_000989 [Paracoccaceae bacterium]
MFCGVAVLAIATAPDSATATTIAYRSFEQNPSQAQVEAVINPTGETLAYLGSDAAFTALDLGATDILMIDYDSASLSTALSARLGEIEAFVRGGGALILHDWRTASGTFSNPMLFGLAALSYGEDSTTDVSIIDAASPIVDGPFGTLTATSLDGGNSSVHTAVNAASLPGSVTAVLGNASASNVTAFHYDLDAGWIYWAGMPLSCYTKQNCNNPPRDAFNDVYTPNLIAFASASVSDVPLPASLPLLAVAAAGLAGIARKRRKAA